MPHYIRSYILSLLHHTFTANYKEPLFFHFCEFGIKLKKMNKLIAVVLVFAAILVLCSCGYYGYDENRDGLNDV